MVERHHFTAAIGLLFNFMEDIKISGRIDLIDKQQFFPGEEGEVEILFLSRKHLGSDFDTGKTFLFGEGKTPLREGKVKKIIQKQSSA